jgi:transposase
MPDISCNIQKNEITDIQIAEIKELISIRDEIDYERIYYICDLLKNNQKLDPLRVIKYDGDWVLLDGYMRLAALKKINENVAECEIIVNETINSYNSLVLLAVSFNIKGTKPLTKNEIKKIIINAFRGKTPVNLIIGLTGILRAQVYNIIRPYLRQEKDEQKKLALSLFTDGRNYIEIADILGKNVKSITRWINSIIEPVKEDELFFEEIRSFFEKEINDTEKKSFLCYLQIKRLVTAEKISESINIDLKFVQMTGILLLYIYQNEQIPSTMIARKIGEYFNIKDPEFTYQSNFLILLFDTFKQYLISREELNVWIIENKCSELGEKSDNLIKNELLGQDHEDPIFNSEPQESHDKVSAKSVERSCNNSSPKLPPTDVIKNCREYADNISNIHEILIEQKNQFDKKQTMQIMEYLNQVITSVNLIFSELRERIN